MAKPTYVIRCREWDVTKAPEFRIYRLIRSRYNGPGAIGWLLSLLGIIGFEEEEYLATRYSLEDATAYVKDEIERRSLVGNKWYF